MPPIPVSMTVISLGSAAWAFRTAAARTPKPSSHLRTLPTPAMSTRKMKPHPVVSESWQLGFEGDTETDLNAAPIDLPHRVADQPSSSPKAGTIADVEDAPWAMGADPRQTVERSTGHCALVIWAHRIERVERPFHVRQNDSPFRLAADDCLTLGRTL